MEMGAAVVKNNFSLHAVFKIFEDVFHNFGFDFVLVVFVVHPNIKRIAEVGVRNFFLVEDNVFETVISTINSFGTAVERRFFILSLTVEAPRPPLLYSDFKMTIGVLLIITTLPTRSSCAVFILILKNERLMSAVAVNNGRTKIF